MSDDPARIIERGYDEIADRFAEWQRGISGETRLDRAEQLLELLPSDAHVLEIGVGAGVRCSQLIAERASLTGVDLSREQLRRAARQLPNATLIHGDATEIEFEPASFDAVAAFYVLNHVPQDRLGPLISKAAHWLRPQGVFLATFPTTENPGWKGDFLGTRMFFAGFPPETNRRLVEGAGLMVLRDEFETTVEPDYGQGRWQWLLAQKP